MKTFLLSIIFFLPSSILFSQTITIGEDNIVRCKGVSIGTTQTVFGDTYEVVDRALLIQRRNEGADLTKVCVSNISDMSEMFVSTSLNYNIGNWDVSNVSNMMRMFYNSTFNQPIGSWDVGKVVNMSEIFKRSTFNQPIGDWDVSNVTNMNQMFLDSPFNQFIANWIVSNVTVMQFMFQNTPFNQPIGNWDVSNVTDMHRLFSSTPFNRALSKWDVSKVTNMEYMFQSTPFNQPIGNWDVSNVTKMGSMFSGSSFNQPIGDWDVSSVKDMNLMFYGSSFNHPIETWDVSNVTTMGLMFRESSFNQPIGSWDVSNVTGMALMFYESLFNQPIGDWDVSNVTNMNEMFRNSIFNQNISFWCVPNLPVEPFRFSLNGSLTSNNKPVWGTCPGFPSKLTQLMPLDNSLDISLNPEFKWSKDSLTTNYQLQIFEGFDPIVLDTLVKDTVFSFPSTLEQNIKYNWRVRGVNENRTSNGMPLTGEWSNVWGFTTQTITSNEIENNPNEFVLNQNYPNPFNPTTQIQFSLPKTTHAKIEVYSIMGQLITTLVNGTMNVGSHTVSFDGKSFSSGMYIYRLSTSEFTQSRMMNLIK